VIKFAVYFEDLLEVSCPCGCLFAFGMRSYYCPSLVSQMDHVIDISFIKRYKTKMNFEIIRIQISNFLSILVVIAIEKQDPMQ
jgi:hypothetical protein